MINGRRLSNVIGFDDGPFDRVSDEPVSVVGAVYAGLRLDGVLVGEVEKDGDDATEQLASLIEASRFREHLQLVMMEGIALGGFNVVDVHALSERLGLPVLVLCRRQPDLDAIRSALLSRVPNGEAKWRRIEAAGPMEPLGEIWIQRAGLPRDAAMGLAIQGSRQDAGAPSEGLRRPMAAHPGPQASSLLRHGVAAGTLGVALCYLTDDARKHRIGSTPESRVV